MIIIRTPTSYIDANPHNLCVMVLSATFFLSSRKTAAPTRKGKVLAIKFSETPSVGEAHKQEDFMCRSSKYSSSHPYRTSHPLARLGLMPL